jgi:hypothetical protein
MMCDELFEAETVGAFGNFISDCDRPSSGQLLVEFLWDAIVIAPSSRSFHETFLRFGGTVPPYENPCDTNVIDMADASPAKTLRLPPIG